MKLDLQWFVLRSRQLSAGYKIPFLSFLMTKAREEDEHINVILLLVANISRVSDHNGVSQA